MVTFAVGVTYLSGRGISYEGYLSVLLVGSLAIGWLWGKDGTSALTLFMLGMGVITAARFADLRRAGAFLIGFGVAVPMISAVGGVLIGWGIGLSVGGATLLAILYASASYIAAPAAMRIAIPDANPALIAAGARGYTVCKASGRGARGERATHHSTRARSRNMRCRPVTTRSSRS